MRIYWTDRVTKEFRGVGEANPDPLETGRFAIPADATTIEPPAVGDKEAAVFSGGAWAIVPDRRGEMWYRAHGELVQIVDLGDPALLDLFEIEPPAPAPTQEQLIAHMNRVQWARATGGYLATVAGVVLPIATTGDSMTLMGGKRQRLNEPNPPAFVNWQTGPTELTPIAAADFIVMSIEVADFVQSTFDAIPLVSAKIMAGEITSFAEVDAEFA